MFDHKQIKVPNNQSSVESSQVYEQQVVYGPQTNAWARVLYYELKERCGDQYDGKI